jgi:BASS family bile acid:Na+ symporter
MPIDGPIPSAILTIAAAATLFTVMFDLGLAIEPGEFRWVARRPGLVLRGLFAVLIAVPALALVVSRAFDLTRAAEIGVVLMAISPGAPVALRRSLDSGGHRSFAPTLQIGVAVLAVVSMPIYIGVLNEYYAGRAVGAPRELARQVFVAQLLPLCLGMLVRLFMPRAAAWVERRLRRLSGVLLIVLLACVLIDIWRPVVEAGWRVVGAIAVTTVLALAVGHLLGGPDPTTRTATAICSAARNAGLALLVAALNAAPPPVIATVVAYVIVSALVAVPYAVWRKRSAPAGVASSST